MRFLFSHILPYRRTLAITFLLATVNQLLLLADPQILRLLIDRYVMRASTLAPNVFYRDVFLLAGSAVLIALLARAARIYQDFHIELTAQKIGARLFTTSIGHWLLLPFSVLEDTRSGDLMQKIEKARFDIERICEGPATSTRSRNAPSPRRSGASAAIRRGSRCSSRTGWPRSRTPIESSFSREDGSSSQERTRRSRRAAACTLRCCASKAMRRATRPADVAHLFDLIARPG